MNETSFSGFVGIDISKDKFDACCIGSNGEKHFHLTCPMDRTGFEKLVSRLGALSISQDGLLIGMESTACYHMNLFSFLLAGGYTTVIINPLLISNFVKMQLRKTKTDKKNALIIAQYLLMYGDTLAQTSIAAYISDLRDLSRQRESLLSQMTALKCDMKRVLTITFPELEKVAGVFTKSMLKLLSRFPSAQAIVQANPAEINQLLVDHSMGRSSAKTTQIIIQAARSSIGTTTPSRELILKQKADVLIHLDGHLKELTAMMIKLCRSGMGDDIDIMTFLGGIGEKTATSFLVEMGGDIRRFKDHKKLIAMAGLDPAIYQSGKHDGQGRITKRGNRHFRRVIWLMSIRVIQYNDCFRNYYKKRMEDGLPFKKAVLASAHKLLRVLFAQPDHNGHQFGENSQEYTDGFKLDDQYSGWIINKLKVLGLYDKTLIYVIADHGFDKDKKTHLYAPFVFAGTNDPTVVRNEGTREDIAPTILEKFGLDLSKIEPKLDGYPFDMQAPMRKANPELTKEFCHKYNYIDNKENNAKKVIIFD